MAGKIIVPILSAFSAKGVKDAEGAIGRLKGVMGELGKSVGNMVGPGAVGSLGFEFIKDAVKQARDLQRNMASVNQVFGDFAKTQKAFINNSASMGLASSDAARATVFVGSVLKQSGFEMSRVSTESEKLVRLASDLAITYGYDVSEALTGMTALFRGEYDPIEKFGVAMKQAEVNAVVAAKGLSHLTGVEKLNAQQQVRLELLYARAADSMGAFKRQGDNLFAQQTIMTAGFENLAAALGTPLLTPLAHAAQMISRMFDGLKTAFVPVFTQLGKFIEHLSPLLKAVGEAIGFVAPLLELLISIFDEAVQLVMPIFLSLWELIKPALKVVGNILKVLGVVVKAIMIPFKALAILFGVMINLVAQFFDFLTGGVTEQISNTFGTMFDGFNGDLDKTNEAMDKIIASVFKLKDTKVVDETGRFLNRFLYSKIVTPNKKELTDEEKKFLESVKNFKSQVADVLKSAMPGALATRELGDFEKAVVDSFRSIFDKISQGLSDKILSGGAAKALRGYATLVKNELMEIASQRDKLANKLDLAKTLIADTKKAVIGFASLSNLMSDVNDNVTRSVSYMVGKFTVTTTETMQAVANASTIIDKFRDIVGKTKDFATNLEKLKAMGISGELYQQILAGGLDQGAAVADALVSGGQTAVDELNGLFGELASTGAGLGEQAAQVMYGAGVDLSDGLINGLLSADEKLKAAAEKLAMSFRNAFNAGISGTGATGGFNAPDVSSIYAENAIASATYTPASATNININVTAGIGTDGAAVGKAIVDSIKKYERTSGRVFARAV